MDIAIIGTGAPIDPIRNKLDNDLSILSKEGLSFQVEKVPLKDFTALKFSVDENATNRLPKDIRILSKQYIASALADVIVEQLEAKIVWHIVKKDYSDASLPEQTKLFALASRMLNLNSASLGGYQGAYKTMRRNRVLYRLLEYFEDNDSIILEGFINFRLRNYLEELQQAVDQAKKELLIEKEQEEFIKLLRYFVDVQNPRERVINVVFAEEGSFELYDGEMQVVSQKYVDEFLLSLVSKTITYDDLLVSALITIAPEELVIHSVNASNHHEVIRMLKQIFLKKVRVCTSCTICSPK